MITCLSGTCNHSNMSTAGIQTTKCLLEMHNNNGMFIETHNHDYKYTRARNHDNRLTRAHNCDNRLTRAHNHDNGFTQTYNHNNRYTFMIAGWLGHTIMITGWLGHTIVITGLGHTITTAKCMSNDDTDQPKWLKYNLCLLQKQKCQEWAPSQTNESKQIQQNGNLWINVQKI